MLIETGFARFLSVTRNGFLVTWPCSRHTASLPLTSPVYNGSLSADEVAEFFALGFEVALEGGFGGDGGRETFDDLDAGGFEGGYFLGIVGHEADRGDTELFENLGRKFKHPEIGGKAELVIGFDRVEALILKLICPEFGHEADAATLLLLVEQDA